MIIEFFDQQTLERYKNIKIRCVKNCQNYFALKDYPVHISECILENCFNFKECKKKAKYKFEAKKLCSYRCYVSLVTKE